MGRLLAFALGLGLALSCIPAFAATAGTVVSNTATLNFEVDGAGRSILSNTVTLIVAERLDVAVVADTPGALAAGPGERAVAFLVTNLGNGTESFALNAAIEGSGASVLKIVADEDGNGLYDPTIDREPANAQLPLAPGKQGRIFVLVGGAQDSFQVALTATAETGSGAPGTAFDGRGDGGGDAIVGQTGATATARTGLALRIAEPTLVKSQVVTAPDGSTRAVKGAIITYRLDANFPRATTAVEIADQIPAGTVYVPGSLMLDSTPQSDAADTDAGRFGGEAIGVVLGDVAPGSRTIIFQVKIQ